MTVIDYATANLCAMEVYADERDRLNPSLKAELIKVVTSPVPTEACSYFVEFVYANASEFLKTSLEKTANVADFVTTNNFFGFGVDDRGVKIASTLRGKNTINPPEPLSKFKY